MVLKFPVNMHYPDMYLLSNYQGSCVAYMGSWNENVWVLDFRVSKYMIYDDKINQID